MQGAVAHTFGRRLSTASTGKTILSTGAESPVLSVDFFTPWKHLDSAFQRRSNPESLAIHKHLKSTLLAQRTREKWGTL